MPGTALSGPMALDSRAWGLQESGRFGDVGSTLWAVATLSCKPIDVRCIDFAMLFGSLTCLDLGAITLEPVQDSLRLGLLSLGPRGSGFMSRKHLGAWQENATQPETRAER